MRVRTHTCARAYTHTHEQSLSHDESYVVQNIFGGEPNFKIS